MALTNSCLLHKDTAYGNSGQNCSWSRYGETNTTAPYCAASVIQAFLLVILLFLLGRFYKKSPTTWKNLPPGPPSFPLVGSIPFLGKDILQGLDHLRKKHGDIFMVSLPRPTVVLNGHVAIKEAFVKQGNAFLGRPKDLIIVKETTKGFGIIFAEADVWHSQRKFCHKALYNIGTGKNRLEVNIQEEVQNLLMVLQKYENKPYNPMIHIMIAISNVIASIVYGNHNDYDNEEFHKFLKNVNEDLLASVGPGSILSLFPFLCHVPGDVFGFESYKRTEHSIFAFIESHISQHMDTYEPNQTRDLIDDFIMAMKKSEANGTSFNEKQLTILIFDLFVAGMETVSATLRWSIVLMVNHPEVQERVKEEIVEVIGASRLPCMKDQSAMPYTVATLLEIQRFGSIASLGAPHETTHDVSLLGYDIPRGTQVMANLYSAHWDLDVWGDPDQFNPDHFLDDKGRVVHRELMIGFSMGKRICLGESMAKMELFLIFTSILQRYTIATPPGQPLPSLDAIFNGTMRTPQNCDIILRPRT